MQGYLGFQEYFSSLPSPTELSSFISRSLSALDDFFSQGLLMGLCNALSGERGWDGSGSDVFRDILYSLTKVNQSSKDPAGEGILIEVTSKGTAPPRTLTRHQQDRNTRGR